MTAEQKPEISFASRFRLRIFQFQSKGRIPADFQIQFYMFPFYAYPGCDKRKKKRYIREQRYGKRRLLQAEGAGKEGKRDEQIRWRGR